MKVFFAIAGNIVLGRGKLEAPNYPHIGIAYMASVLKQHGHDVRVMDMRLHYTQEELNQAIGDYQPDMVGFSLWSFQYLTGYRAIDAIKAAHPAIPVVAGGPHIASFGDHILRNSKVDYAYNGEGDLAILEIVAAVTTPGSDLSQVGGLIWRNGEEIVNNPKRELVKNLDDLPYPDFDLFELDRYLMIQQRKLLPLISSRGCPFKCVYCSIQQTMGWKFRGRSAKSVVDEMEHWVNRGYRAFDFNDDVFTLNRRRAKEVCDLIVERGLKIEYRFWNGIRADEIDRELAQKLVRSGCTFASFGVETGNVEVMRRIKKNLSFDKLYDGIRYTNEVGLTNQTNFIIGHPEETYAEASDTIRFAAEVPSTFTTFANAIPYPGTALYEWAKENARLRYPAEVFLNELEYSELNPIFETDAFTAEQRVELLKKGVAISRRRIVEFMLGKFFGKLFFPIIGNDFMWIKLGEIFQNNVRGLRFFTFWVRVIRGKFRPANA